MNPKERYYSGVARETIHRITANRENWTSFLATMARNYDFTYPEQVMIYAQRPNATLTFFVKLLPVSVALMLLRS